MDTADGWADVSVSGPAEGAQTGTSDWYDWDGNPIGSGQASVLWTPTGAKVTRATPTQTANRVEHVTGYRLIFDVAGPVGGGWHTRAAPSSPSGARSATSASSRRAAGGGEVLQLTLDQAHA